MSEEQKVLTKEIAEELIKDDNAVNLECFTSIEDDAAQVLSKFQGRQLYLEGLENLTVASAKALADFPGHLRFWALEHLPDAVAAELAKQKVEPIDADLCDESELESELAGLPFLDLSGLKSLSDSAATELAKHQGSRLDLSGLENLSENVALILSAYRGSLSFSYVEHISDGAAAALAKHRGPDICLVGLKELSDEAAKSLASYPGELNLSSGAAAAVAKFKQS